MNLYEEIENEINSEKIERSEEQLIAANVKIAEKYKWGFTNFKRFMSQFLLDQPTEDMFVSDYQCFLLSINPDKYEHPMYWAELYYAERWDKVMFEEAVNQLKNLSQNGNL